jgi:hypothetical protein
VLFRPATQIPALPATQRARRFALAIALTVGVGLAGAASPIASALEGGERITAGTSDPANPAARDDVNPASGDSANAPFAVPPRRPWSASTPPAVPRALVELRCWQEGQLIIHESRLAAASEPFPYLVRFPSTEPGVPPVYLADTRNSTCVIRPIAAESDAARRQPTTPKR